MSAYLVFDIGCIECGESSSVVGIFATKAEAEAAAEDYIDPEHRWGREGWIGQHSVELFEIELPATVAVTE